MIEEQELDQWWRHLSVESKEAVFGVPYPTCTVAWNVLARESKEQLYHKHGGRDAHTHHKALKKGPTFT